ncbi:MAG TPA: arginine N-succinyltransferase [Gammaproteobacteria bacterium]|nr:arginine N-succinyltransferase [Gammaproteobacteria bacterium]
MDTETTAGAPERRHLSGLQITLIVLATIVVTVGATYWVLRTYIFPAEFRPVELSAKEEQVLNAKLERLDSLQTRRTRGAAKAARRGEAGATNPESLEPEAYSEAGADRSITLTERELNGLLAKNTDLARKLAIDLSDDLMSAKLLVPVDEDFPILGGQTLKVRAGLELAYRDSRPVVVLKGISIMGVPVPNAWLGGMKNIDLVEYYGHETGFWKAFADGVDNIRIQDGNITMVLKE